MSELIERLEEAEAACLDMDQEVIADEDFADLLRMTIEALKELDSELVIVTDEVM